jgi:organic radical activating enzyme
LKKNEVFLAVDKRLKNIIPRKCHHYFSPLRKRISPHFVRTLSGIWCVTWQCNFACPYCWQRQDPQTYRVKNDISCEQWLNIWEKISERFDDIRIGITGGEPFLYGDFIRLLTELPDNISYEITSNLSLLNVEEFLSYEKLRKHCLGIACSFHPSNPSNSTDYMDVFFDKARKLSVLTYTKIIFVPADSDLRFYEALRNFCDENRIVLQVKKNIVPPERKDDEPREERITSGESASEGIPVNESYMHEEVSCSSGFSHLALLPNADVWPCYTKAALKEDYIGNLLSEEFSFNTGYMDCSFYPSCWGVDYHSVDVLKKKKS